MTTLLRIRSRFGLTNSTEWMVESLNEHNTYSHELKFSTAFTTLLGDFKTAIIYARSWCNANGHPDSIEVMHLNHAGGVYVSHPVIDINDDGELALLMLSMDLSKCN